MRNEGMICRRDEERGRGGERGRGSERGGGVSEKK